MSNKNKNGSAAIKAVEVSAGPRQTPAKPRVAPRPTTARTTPPRPPAALAKFVAETATNVLEIQGEASGKIVALCLRSRDATEVLIEATFASMAQAARSPDKATVQWAKSAKADFVEGLKALRRKKASKDEASVKTSLGDALIEAGLNKADLPQQAVAQEEMQPAAH